MSEKDLMHEIMIAASQAGHRLMRNNVGMFQAMPDGRWIRYGVGGKGGSDLIGMTRQGRFAAIEVKKGSVTVEQIAFIEMVRRQGGVAGVAYSVEEALAILDQ